jgi:hypothetical protein
MTNYCYTGRFNCEENYVFKDDYEDIECDTDPCLNRECCEPVKWWKYLVTFLFSFLFPAVVFLVSDKIYELGSPEDTRPIFLSIFYLVFILIFTAILWEINGTLLWYFIAYTENIDKGKIGHFGDSTLDMYRKWSNIGLFLAVCSIGIPNMLKSIIRKVRDRGQVLETNTITDTSSD